LQLGWEAVVNKLVIFTSPLVVYIEDFYLREKPFCEGIHLSYVVVVCIICHVLILNLSRAGQTAFPIAPAEITLLSSISSAMYINTMIEWRA
jgi:hypothetical protein